MEDFSLWKAISFNPWWLGLFINVGKGTWKCKFGLYSTWNDGFVGDSVALE